MRQPLSTIILGVSALLASQVSAAANKLTLIPSSAWVTSRNPNPSNATFYLYVPTNLTSNPAIIVNPHWCHGSASAAFSGTQLATLADKYGYLMIFPDSPNLSDHCWDVASPQTLTHGSGGDSQGIISMVNWTIKKYNADQDRVFAMGTSSGAMMTNVLLAVYPEVFSAGMAWAGVAAGCFAPSPSLNLTASQAVDYWSDTCATGKNIKTGAEWKSTVEAMSPGFKGLRPKMWVLHGSADTILYPQNLEEEVKEWSTVLDVQLVETRKAYPKTGWETRVFGKTGGHGGVGGEVDRFRATLASGVTHDIQTDAGLVLEWFGI
ncbi:Alpha/Beta hydrolase protein [Tricladium varicosporioides]|nr:Alpha/Beta hydrolase protein [Hymenoscyphus varicosporioides]